ncbi:MAG TPA: M24 family metallopeptidase [Actinomycetota bacterium]|nr:M24 family metallopeptidase [Actinomycetota bacterium]
MTIARTEDGYPRFSDAEIARRRAAIEDAMGERGVSHLVLYGANRFGSAVQWLTSWPVTREAAVVVTPGERDVLLVQFHNHVPNARRLARDAEVRWGGPSTIAAAVEALEERGAGGGAVGVAGPVTGGQRDTIAASFGDVVDLSGPLTSLRLVKSAEELDWIRVGAELSDRSIEALRREVVPGLTEHDLAAIVEAAYLAEGGVNHIHYFGVTSMAAPERAVPAQFPSDRRLATGDALATEISASFWDHPGQVLRTFTIAADPTPLYRELHDVAQAAFDAMARVVRDGAHVVEAIEAATVIEDVGFTTYDDLVHGFVGGYLPPLLGSRSRTLEPPPDMTFRTGMTVVMQPNVITRDERAGVQTGELVHVTRDGVERLHRAPPGLARIGG